MSRPTTVYGIFRDLTPVYIGVSYNPRKRLTTHKVVQRWWSKDLWMRELITCAHRADALAIEAGLIEQLEPEFQYGMPLTDTEQADLHESVNRTMNAIAAQHS